MKLYFQDVDVAVVVAQVPYCQSVYTASCCFSQTNVYSVFFPPTSRVAVLSLSRQR